MRVHKEHSSGYSIQETLGFDLPMHTFEIATASASNKRVLYPVSKHEMPVALREEACLKPKLFENDSLKEVEINGTLSSIKIVKK